MRLLSKLLSSSRRQAAATPTQDVSEPVSFGEPVAAQDFASVIVEATAHLNAGRFAQALALIDSAAQSNTHDGALASARGSTLFAWGRYREARELLLRAARAGLQDAALHTKLGWTSLWLGHTDEAAEAMRRATELHPDDWATHFGLATVLRAQKRASQSKVLFERALALNPEDPHCMSSLIACELDLNDFDAAERLARGAVTIHPKRPGAFADLGMALCSQERHQEAIAAFEHAEALEADDAEMGDDCVNFAICLLRAGRTQQALAMMERRLRVYPSAPLQSHFALAMLISGRLPEGWEHYEFRWMDEPLLSARPNFLKPQWNGQDLQGRTILLWSEQGFGDFIQFIRYADLVKAQGARVLVFLREELRELAEGMPCIDQILTPNQPYPPFDYYINLLSLPRIFRTDLASIPAGVPYLKADAKRAAGWAEKLRSDAMLKVGIVWAGSPTHLRDRFRSLSFESLAPLLQVSGVRVFSMQKGPPASVLAGESSAAIIDIGADLATFADTAAAIDQLDLVIGVDTAVVHLAGALGKPVWTLVATPADWRWLEDREDSPWYPTMRLFRQRSAGDWDDVIERVRTELEYLVMRHGASTPPPAVLQGKTPPVRPPVRVDGNAATAADEWSRVAETRMGILQYFPNEPEIGQSIAFYGEHRQLQLEFLGRFIVAGMTGMEIGAGVGAHALWLSRRIGPEGHLFLYENGVRRQLLEQNLRSNRIRNATLMRRRLRRRPIEIAPVANFGTGDRPASRTSAAEQEETIDELRLDRLDFLKMNSVDDALEVLEGAGETLWRLRPRLFLTASGDEPLDRLASRAGDFGYGSWRRETPLFNPRNFNNRNTDVFPGQTTVSLIAFPEELNVDLTVDDCQRLA